MPDEANRDQRTHYRPRGRANPAARAQQRRLTHLWAAVLQRFRDYMAAGGPTVNREESDVKP